MKLRTLGLAAVLLAVFAVPAIRAEETKEVSLAGEVVDLHCYITKHGGEGSGAKHAGCANSCINRGVSAGFLAKDGTLYVLFNAEMSSPKDAVAGLAGKPVTATGFVLERDGVKAFRLVKIEAAPDAP
jgi:hypothetical protein